VSVQYRVVFGKNDEAVDGPDDAAVVVTVGAADAVLDPSVAFMQGKLKSTGPTGPLFAAFADGSAAAVLSRLALRP
jgi:hypothetical protein